jgi:hypothetical protein
MLYIERSTARSPPDRARSRHGDHHVHSGGYTPSVMMSSLPARPQQSPSRSLRSAAWQAQAILLLPSIAHVRPDY